MKPTIPFALLGALFAVGAATAATTTPVGYVALGDTTVGQPAVKASTDVAISVPLHKATEFAGAVASTTATTITVSGTPAWAANQWTPGAANPYLVAITSGPQEGFLGLITSHTADTLTVTPVTSGSLTSVVAADTVKIFGAWTLKTLFPTTLPAGTRVLAFSGTVPGENLASNLQYVWSGTQWTQLVGGSGNADNTIVYSGESIVLRAPATQIATLAVTGEVPTFNHRTDINKLGAGNQDNRISFFSPVDEVIGVSGLGFTAGDRLLAFNNNSAGINKAANEVLVWSGTAWTGLVGVSGNQTGIYTLKGGRGYVYRRASTAPIGNTDWSNEQTYIPSL